MGQPVPKGLLAAAMKAVGVTTLTQFAKHAGHNVYNVAKTGRASSATIARLQAIADQKPGLPAVIPAPEGGRRVARSRPVTIPVTIDVDPDDLPLVRGWLAMAGFRFREGR